MEEPPDPRYSLANERTFLAWIRTTLAVVAGAVALHSLALPDERWLRTTVVVSMLLFGAVTSALAYLRWRAIERAMRRGEPLPGFALGAWMAGAVVLASLLLLVAVV